MFRLKNPAISGVALPGKEGIICIACLDPPLKAAQLKLPFKARIARNSWLLRRFATQKLDILGAIYEFTNRSAVP
jgi:hypothetical protein